MDVVRSNVERIGGIVEVDSRVGEGTRMTLRVPLTLTIIPALTVSIGSQHFAIPRSAIEEIVRANGEIGHARAHRRRRRRDHPRPPRARSLARRHPRPRKRGRRGATARLIVLRPAGGDVYALAVDRIHDHEELVVKPAAPAVMATGLYAGTTLADDGSPILLFDPPGWPQVGGVKLEAQERAARIAEGPAAAEIKATAGAAVPRSRRRPPRASPRRSSTGSRKCRRARSSKAAGQLRVQLGEAILPLAGASATEIGEDKVRLFRLNDGSHEIGYAFARSASTSRPSTMTSFHAERARAKSAACR